MIIQLNPMIPLYVPEFNMEGYAFLVDSPSEEHFQYFTIAMDNGEIWILDNTRVRFCKNHSQQRATINKTQTSELKNLLDKTT